MSDYLLIGPVLLEAFELPAQVGWGGRQRLAVHRLPGGRRVIDAMRRATQFTETSEKPMCGTPDWDMSSTVPGSILRGSAHAAKRT